MNEKKYQLEEFIRFIKNGDGILQMETTGFISKEAAQDIREEYLRSWKREVDQFHDESFVLIVDLRDSSVPSDEARTFLVEGMTYALNHGMVGAIEVVSAALVKMSTKRMVQAAEIGKKMDFRYQVEYMGEAFEKAQELLVLE